MFNEKKIYNYVSIVEGLPFNLGVEANSEAEAAEKMKKMLMTVYADINTKFPTAPTVPLGATKLVPPKEK